MTATAFPGAAGALRRLPSVEKLLETESFVDLARRFGRTELVRVTRELLDELRGDVLRGALDERGVDGRVAGLADEVARRAEAATRPSLVPVVNATGIIVHTNLGRAPLSDAARAAVERIARGYSNLELDLATGKRGSRHRHAGRLFARLFPDREALVVNNNAAAVLLALNTFARGREVLVSRGELVEIGGSFRIPEILERSGARLREVGTTNKTRLADYASAIGPDTAAILRVHPSNFRIVGFTETTPIDALVRLGRERSLPVIEDFGSGNLLPLDALGLGREPTVQASVDAGVDIVTFSGDKLLGGPQAGILLGPRERIEACQKNPLARALRVDKMTYAALEATLAAFVREKALEEIPVLRMLATPVAAIRRRAESLAARLADADGLVVSLRDGASKIGGGAAPEEEVPTVLLAVSVRGRSAKDVLDALRGNEPPVIARIADERVLLDPRTVAPEEDALVEAALRAVAAARP